MARRVFFSFHYDDIMATNVIRNSDKIKSRYERATRFYDKSLWEEAKRTGDFAIKRLIDGALDGSSVTCVLIGQETWERHWVRYEILQSLARGNGILGIQIHDVGVAPFSWPGRNPFDYLAYSIRGDMVRFVQRNLNDIWSEFSDIEPVPLHSWRWPWQWRTYHLGRQSEYLGNLFPVYDWKQDEGYDYLPIWLEEAAVKVGR